MAAPPISTSHNLGMELKGREIFSVLCTRDSAHKTFGPTDLTSTYSVCTRRVYGGIGHRTQAFQTAAGVRSTINRNRMWFQHDEVPARNFKN
ncbi:hypothetical protein TNCV_5015931 [Trichonephila clavipes]|nr:hypothetical protein TNCV_5015931 [Trichonephila clavipes]